MVFWNNNLLLSGTFKIYAYPGTVPEIFRKLILERSGNPSAANVNNFLKKSKSHSSPPSKHITVIILVVPGML